MSKTIKNVCVYGIGGVGGYFGGKKIAHEIIKGNHAIQIHFIAREEHLKAIQKHGLNLLTDKGEFVCYPNVATDDVE